MRFLNKLFNRPSRPTVSNAPVLFENTLSGTKEIFSPIKAGQVSLYSCGPTVYNQAHIGNLRPYVFSDLVARVLEQAGYRTRRVINITDVGHLESDADDGEDKMEKGARREGVSASDIATKYTELFLADIRALNLDTKHIRFPHATDYIKEQIAIVEILEKKGLTYRTYDGIYFDTQKFPGYGKLGNVSKNLSREEALAGVGRRITENKEKHHPADFALWKLSPPGSMRQQEWQSPWGRGFPGWHIECSAMSRTLLGQPFDIHTGGIDHIPVHHNDEMAQSEAAFDMPLARFWLHGAFLNLDGERFAKSEQRVIYLSEIIERGYSPLALRYLFLQAHYRSPMNFTWDALAAAHEALTRLTRASAELHELAKGRAKPSDASRRMVALLRDDLATPQALALLWEVVKDEDMLPAEAWGVIECADRVLGLGLTNPEEETEVEIPEDVQKLLKERDIARVTRNFERSDELRIHIEKRGYAVEDTPSGTIVTRRPG